jgi:hypothetical protein
MMLDYTYPPLYVVIIIPLLLLLILNSFHKTMALSPSFELREIVNENHHWVQTYGNSDAHLKSNYTDIRSVEYISDGKTLNVTFWLAAGLKNSSAAIYNQPFIETSYGMLIDADINSKTGYFGADYDYYIESAAGKLTAYLYQLSSTGGYRLEESEPLDTNVLQNSVSFALDLKDIGFPSKYNLLFYSAESYKSNEVKQFTGWVPIPPRNLRIVTLPSNITIREGEQQLIPARIKSASGFSIDVANISVGLPNGEMGLGFNPSEVQVGIVRIQPALLKITVPEQTPIGIYTIPLNVTIRQPSVAVLTKPISINTKSGQMDLNSIIPKRYPTVGYISRTVNLTITVVPPRTIGDQFRDFWGVYGGFITIIGIIVGGLVGAFATMMFERRKKRMEIK